MSLEDEKGRGGKRRKFAGGMKKKPCETVIVAQLTGSFAPKETRQGATFGRKEYFSKAPRGRKFKSCKRIRYQCTEAMEEQKGGTGATWQRRGDSKTRGEGTQTLHFTQSMGPGLELVGGMPTNARVPSKKDKKEISEEEGKPGKRGL